MADTYPSSANALTFPFESRNVRAVLRNGEPWFVAADVCAALELRDTSNVVGRLDEDERGTHTVRTPSGDQQMLVINESGLYSLILTSRKPEAKRFKKWVTSEVLPAIRRTGRYEATPPVEPALSARVGYIAELARSGCLSASSLVDVACRLAPATAHLAAPATVAQAFTADPAPASDYASVEVIAIRFSMTPKLLNNLLARNRWQAWNNDGWFPTRLGAAHARIDGSTIRWCASSIQELVAKGDGHAESLF